MIDEKEPEGFVEKDRKRGTRIVKRTVDGGKRIHPVGQKKDRWRFKPEVYDDSEETDDESL